MGLIEDEDYVLFKKPPDFFERPLIPLRKFDHVVSFKTGLALCCASQKVEGSANGYNGQSAIIEETKYVKQSKIKTELYKALRGQLKYFGHLPEYRSVWSFSDKYEGDVSWILELRDKQNPKLIQAVLTMALHVIELQKKLAEVKASNASEQYCYEIKRQILSKENTLNAIRKEMVYVCEMGAFENIENLGEKFYRDAKRDAKSKQEYNVAILNQDPTKSEKRLLEELTALATVPVITPAVVETLSVEIMPDSTDNVLMALKNEWMPLYQSMNYKRHQLDRYQNNSAKAIAERKLLAFEVIELEQKYLN